MRYYSHTTLASNVIVLDGLSFFPGEITNRLIDFLQIDRSTCYNYTFSMVFSGARPAREYLMRNLSPSDFRILDELRQWFDRLQRREKTGTGSVHVIINLNTADSLVFISDSVGGYY
jgi:hypothetical protein